MELQTRQFGRIDFEQQDVLDLAGIEPADSTWLLLADKSHPHLYWLQSISDSSCAMPLCSIRGIDWAGALRVPRSQALPEWTGHTSLIALAEIRVGASECSLDLGATDSDRSPRPPRRSAAYRR